MPGRANFFKANDYILYGLSPKRKTFAHAIKEGLEGMGFRVYPVNPKAKGNGYYEISSLSGKTDRAIIVVNKSNALSVLEDLKNNGVKQAWLQFGAYNKNVINQFNEAGIKTFTGCVMMYLPNSSAFHKLHGFIYNLFRKDK